MSSEIIIVLIVLLSLITCALMVRCYIKQRHDTQAHALSIKKRFQCVVIGIIAFFADTIGVGSFAVEIAGAKLTGLLPDLELPGLVNGAQVIAGALEAILFLHIIHVDPLTLIVLVVGTCIGGTIGGVVVSHLNQRHIQIIMTFAFILMAMVLLANQLHIIHIAGHDQLLRGTKLWIGFFGMVISGMLTAVGVGLFALVEVLLLLLGLSPFIAFPIMTTAGALQQPFTTSAFALNNRIPIKATFIVGLAGIIGVLVAMPLVTHLSFSILRWLLLIIVIINAIMMFRSYLKQPINKKN